VSMFHNLPDIFLLSTLFSIELYSCFMIVIVKQLTELEFYLEFTTMYFKCI
jgi:hypothetical protein